jgi:hypothetical protein
MLNMRSILSYLSSNFRLKGSHASTDESKEEMSTDVTKKNTYASIKKGTYALKRDFNASTRYL